MNFEEQVIDAKSEEELKKIKLFLFQEQVKIQAKKDELCEISRELQEERRAIESERRSLNLKIKTENKRFQDNEKFMASKQQVLENAYRQLAVDKKVLEVERLNFEYEKRMFKQQKLASRVTTYEIEDYGNNVYFRGVDNQLALKKRYKDLLKIYHPDNRCGDSKTLLQIQKEYENIRREYYDV